MCCLEATISQSPDPLSETDPDMLQDDVARGWQLPLLYTPLCRPSHGGPTVHQTSIDEHAVGKRRQPLYPRRQKGHGPPYSDRLTPIRPDALSVAIIYYIHRREPSVSFPPRPVWRPSV